MVFYLISMPPYNFTMYMGRDKFENDELFKYGFPEDIWFHVENLSSAHVYLRIPKEWTIDDIPPELVEECAQLVKENSIKGRKLNNVKVIYTPYGNLDKQTRMDYGEVSHHQKSLVRRTVVESKDRNILNRIKKTKELVEMEQHAEFRRERDRKDREAERLRKESNRVKELEEIEQNRLRKRVEHYEDYFDDFSDMMTYPEDMDENYEDDFM